MAKGTLREGSRMKLTNVLKFEVYKLQVYKRNAVYERNVWPQLQTSTADHSVAGNTINRSVIAVELDNGVSSDQSEARILQHGGGKGGGVWCYN